MQKTLEGANLKLGDVASNALGVSGRQILQALVAGTTDPVALADLAHGRLRDKRPALERAIAGRMGAHQRFLLAEQLCHLDALEESIARVSGEIAERLRPFEDVVARLDGIPDVGRRTAEILAPGTSPPGRGCARAAIRARANRRAAGPAIATAGCGRRSRRRRRRRRARRAPTWGRSTGGWPPG